VIRSKDALPWVLRYKTDAWTSKQIRFRTEAVAQQRATVLRARGFSRVEVSYKPSDWKRRR
jgi:hypothetical protein